MDLARHAEKASARVVKVSVPELEKQRVEVAGHYQQAVDDLTGIVEETPAIACETAAPAVEEERSADRIAEMKGHFADLKDRALREA